MSRRGRPPQPRAGVDRGTPELQARRARLAGGADPALTSYPLGVLLANGDIGEDAHEAACRYAWLYGFVFGRTGAAARGWMGAPKGEPREFAPEVAAAIESDFRAAAGILARQPAAKRRCRAKASLYAHVLHDFDEALAMKQLETDALSNLRVKSAKKLATSRLLPTGF